MYEINNWGGRFVSMWIHKSLIGMSVAQTNNSISVWPFPLDSNKMDPWPWWLLHHLGWIYVPNTENLQLCVLHIHMITPLQDISVRQRHSTKFGNITTGLDSFMSRTTADHVLPVPMPNPTLQTSQATSNPEKPWNSISMDFIEKLPPLWVTPWS